MTVSAPKPEPLIDSIYSRPSPLDMYHSQIGQKLIADPAQKLAVLALDKLYHQFTDTPKSQQVDNIIGLYLWGDVGRGKTYLMDMFYQCLPDSKKLRQHFHRFMAWVHQELRNHSGQQDPLIAVANKLANHYQIICFDEFFVSDIGDAMILAGLFDRLFKRGVILVATSNTPIERLYENGLARHKFLPCIALLQQHTKMVHLDGELDHRLHSLVDRPSDLQLKDLSRYIGLKEELDFSAIFDKLTQSIPTAKVNTTNVTICHRAIQVIRTTQANMSNSVVWFDFFALCDGPRSQLDYIEIASSFKTIMVSGVPQLGGEVRGWIKARGTEDGIGDNQASSTGERIVSYATNDDMTRRFISLVDELYDQKVRLYLSTDVPLNELYPQGSLLFEFRRTYSRLIEMSQD